MIFYQFYISQKAKLIYPLLNRYKVLYLYSAFPFYLIYYSIFFKLRLCIHHQYNLKVFKLYYFIIIFPNNLKYAIFLLHSQLEFILIAISQEIIVINFYFLILFNIF